jgi:hypothetical protein
LWQFIEAGFSQKAAYAREVVGRIHKQVSGNLRGANMHRAEFRHFEKLVFPPNPEGNMKYRPG